METKGHVYVLESNNCDCIKIGGTNYPPAKRLQEINNTEPYKSLGPWHIFDYREVFDWRKIEHNLHYQFRDFQNNEIKNQKELFHISKFQAKEALNAIDPEEILYRPKIDRLFQDERFLNYISELFINTGLIYCADIQGVWTLSIFTQTNNGRYFTINIGSHEVAFSTLNKNNCPQINYIVVDKMILDSEYSEIRNWVLSHNGEVGKASYSTATERAMYVSFESDFKTAMELMSMKGFRRIVIAYWYDVLISKRNEKKLSTYEHFHNYNAVVRILEFIESRNEN